MDKLKERLTIFGICEVLLLIGFIVFRFVLFGMHGMKAWPVDLFVAASVLCFAGAVVKGYFTCAFTAVGYIMGFALATGIESGANWLVWLVIFVAGAVTGIVLDIFMKLKVKRK